MMNNSGNNSENNSGNNSIEEVREVLKQYDSILLCGHTNPDGDAIGSVLALATSLSLIGKKVQVYLETYGKRYDTIPNKHFIVKRDEIKECELFVSLDCGDKDRFSMILNHFKKAKKTLNIDHHISNPSFADMNYVIKGASSTCEIVYHILEDTLPINRDICTALYAGIIFDTGGFRHSSTTAETLRIASELMKYDIPFNDIYIQFFDTKPFSEIKITAAALQNAKLCYDGKLIVSTITKEELKLFDATHEDIGGVVSYIKGVEGVKIACFLYEKAADGQVKVSLRCDDGYDVAAFAQRYGGGGHVKAAGCTLKMSMAEAEKKILEEIKELL
ncbi:MAG: bifunctional oligoribonuclease/PAP phosphatase NrnA [Bacillota bacterium]